MAGDIAGLGPSQSSNSKVMKQLAFTILTVACLAFNASATLFQGTIVGTVVDPSPTPPFGFTAAGDTFTGTYSYESPTVDGIFLRNSGNLQISFEFPDSTVLTQSDVVSSPALNVFGGSVGSLDFIEAGGPIFDVLFLHWEAAASFADQPAKGTLAFSTPTPVSSSVPDTSNSLGLLALGLVGLPFCRRWVK